MAELYTQLKEAAGDRERRNITAGVIDTMRLNPGDLTANLTYYGLCQTIISRHQSSRDRVEMSGGYGGVFPADASAALVLTPRRVSGFLRAINGIPRVEGVIEAGPGASGIFSVAAARRGAKVVAVEIDPMAAECAQEIAELTGYGEQIKVRAGDILADSGLPEQVDLLIAEILGPGLRSENGPAIIAALSKRARYTIPDEAIIYATDSPDHEGLWQELTKVDLTKPTSRISGVFASTGAGSRRIQTRADIHSQGRGIVTGIGTDDLNRPINIGDVVNIPSIESLVEVSYDIGPAPYSRPDVVRVLD